MAEISANSKPRTVATNSQKKPEEYLSEHQRNAASAEELSFAERNSK